MKRRLRLPLALGAAAALWVLVAGAPPMPAFAAVRDGFRSSDAVLQDRSGAPLQRLRLNHRVRRLQWVALADVSPALPRAVLAAEDRRFYRHGGVDWPALAGAAVDDVLHHRRRGASTVTMQLAALLDPALQGGRGGRSLWQKWGQIRAAGALEARWSKAQILEAYLNLVSFRGELQGVDAASRGLFHKAPSGLDHREAAVLAALIRAPNAGAAALTRRTCALVHQLGGSDRCIDIGFAIAQVLGRGAATLATSRGAAPQLARQRLHTAGSRVPSTLDGGLQRFALDSLRQHLAVLGDRNVNDGALVVLDNASGDVLAYVANAGGSAVDGVTARRQPGSTLKPFLYGLAISARQLTAASVLDDAPLDIATPGGLYIPQNYDRHFKGPVSVRTSLASSLNVPAVRTLLLTGVEAFHEQLKRLGFASIDRPADYYGYSLALGSAEVTLLELTNAYRALADGGRWQPVRFDPRAAPAAGRPALDPRAAFVVADILSDRAARSVTFGLDSVLATPFWAAVKTGTSKDMRDNWCVGFTRRYTVGVWVGNFDGAPMWDVSGITGAAPVWREVMEYLQRGVPDPVPAPPPGVRARSIVFQPALEQPRREWFLAGTGSDVIAVPAAARRIPRILYPGDGVIIGLDPDIPAHRQRVVLQARAGNGLYWQLDGRRRGAAADLAWAPQPGRHVLELVDGRGRVIDTAHFEVRGSASALARAHADGSSAGNTLARTDRTP